nr:DUF2314 domain-containing protein [uncultured Kingella sp.]
MSFFSKLFGKKPAKPQQPEPVFFNRDEDGKMDQAIEEARKTFKYFWRECYWEQRRFVKGLSHAVVKAPFFQETDDGKINIEHMWLDDIAFDGEHISGTLLNQPNVLTNVQAGDRIEELPYTEITDWMLADGKKTYGAFTAQLWRARMSDAERAEHDEILGLDFGDYNNVQVVLEQDTHPEYLAQHPADVNMADGLRDYLRQHPKAANQPDENGQTPLHHAAIAGNAESVRVLLAMGAIPQQRDARGKTATDYAAALGWDDVAAVLK